MKLFTVNNDPDDNNFLKSLPRELLAEFIGTFMLVMIGCSAGVALQANPDNIPNFQVDKWAVNICWGFGAFVGIACSFNITGGHLNPAVTIAFASLRRFDLKKVIPYIISQMLGAIAGTAVAYSIYIDIIDKQNRHDMIGNNTRHMTYGHVLSTGKFFATYPETHMKLFGAILDQTVGTASLLFSVMTVVDQKNLDIPKPLQPLVLAFIIGVHAIAFGFNEGAPLNPARDLGPRIFCSWVIYGKEAFTALDSNYWWAGGILGPILGAIIGVWVYYFFIEYPNRKENMNNNLVTTVESYHQRKINTIADYSGTRNMGNGSEHDTNNYNNFVKSQMSSNNRQF